jgi:FkbM family methyltransferase
MLPFRIKSWLEKKQGYLQFRYSRRILNGWLLLRPGVRKELQRQRKLYLTEIAALGDSSNIVFDIGANEGFLTEIFAGAGYTVIAVEPDDRNFAILQARFEKNPNIKLLKAAVTSKPGQIGFFKSKHEAAFGTLSEKWKLIRQKAGLEATVFEDEMMIIDSTTLDELINKYGQPSFIKVDVEGHEEAVLQGLSHSIPLLSFEAILPEFLPETIAGIAHLQKLNPLASFNFSIGNKMVYPQFTSNEKLLEEIASLTPQTIEVFCKM